MMSERSKDDILNDDSEVNALLRFRLGVLTQGVVVLSDNSKDGSTDNSGDRLVFLRGVHLVL